MDIYIEDYGYDSVEQFNSDLEEYRQAVINHTGTLGVPAPLPQHDVFNSPIGNVLSRLEEDLKKEIEDQHQKEKQEKEQQELIAKQEQDEINKCDVNHPDYDYEYARQKEYGSSNFQLEYIVENGLVLFIERQNKIKEMYPKND